MNSLRQHLSQLEVSGLVRIAQVEPELESFSGTPWYRKRLMPLY